MQCEKDRDSVFGGAIQRGQYATIWLEVSESFPQVVPPTDFLWRHLPLPNEGKGACILPPNEKEEKKKRRKEVQRHRRDTFSTRDAHARKTASRGQFVHSSGRHTRETIPPEVALEKADKADKESASSIILGVIVTLIHIYTFHILVIFIHIVTFCS